MIKNFKQGEWQEQIWYELTFDDGRGNGFVFPCDENGAIPEDLNEAAKRNCAWCIEHPERFERFNKVIKRTSHYRENNSGVCECGETIELWNEYLGACECPNCGRWYNLFGQELNPPDTWREGGDW